MRKPEVTVGSDNQGGNRPSDTSPGHLGEQHKQLSDSLGGGGGRNLAGNNTIAQKKGAVPVVENILTEKNYLGIAPGSLCDRLIQQHKE